jgi:hypothetical protein
LSVTSESAWSIDPNEFPANGTAREKLAFLAGYAVLAPSGHNTQPWRFVLGDTHVDVVADMSRALKMVDPHDREMIISCGAAAETLLAAAKAFDLSAELLPLPEADAPTAIARVTLGPSQATGAVNHAMLNAIASRRTVRRPYAETAVPSFVQGLIKDAARPFGVTLHLTDNDQIKDAIAELVVDADHIQFANPAFRDELASWMHPLSSDSGDGLSGPGLGFPDALTRMAAALFRTFNVGGLVATMDKPAAMEAPLIGVFTTPGDTRAEWIATGRALAAVLHILTMNGLVNAFLNQPIEVEETRPELARLVAPGQTPQLLSRFGYLKEGVALPPHAARRSLDEVLIAA